MFNKILVPLDGSKTAEAALEQAMHLAKSNQGSIRLVQACPGPISADYTVDVMLRQPVLERDRHEVEKYLKGVEARVEQEGIPVEIRVLESGDPAYRVLEDAEGDPVDLIVLNSHGRSGIARFLMGSVAEKVARHATCPVLIVRKDTPQS
jgi:nucleotide-binding universal stress UspA family protein